MKLLAPFRQPYPFYYRGRSLWKITLAVFLFAFTFYYLLEPFSPNKDEHRMGFAWVSLIHALVPSIVLLLMGVPALFNRDVDDGWTLRSEFLFLVVFLVLAGAGQYLIRDLIYYNHDNWDLKFLVEEIRNTLLIGVIFVTGLTLINFNRLYQKNWLMAREASAAMDFRSSHQHESVLQLKTEVKADVFELDTDSFLFARAFRNYTEISIIEGGTVNKLLKRISASQLEKQLESYPFIFRSHRSYLVNLDRVVRVTGNAQGYQLTIDGCKEPVPVSRGLIPAFDKKIRSN